jgi:hypothetical protein
MQMQTSAVAVGRHPRTISHTTAVVKTADALHQYDVTDLSVRGATLAGGPSLRPGSVVLVILQVPLYPEIRVPAKVLGCAVHGGHIEVSLVFKHQSDHTEDHIQAALLSELERSQTNMRLDFAD